MSKLFIHLGYPKTGTTTLQHCVFDVLHQASIIHYLGMGGWRRDKTPDRKAFFVNLTDALYLENDEDFSTQLPSLRAAYDELVSNVPDSIPIVLSNEHFLLATWSGKIRGARIFPSRSAHRLGQLFETDTSGLMIGTRDIDALVRSIYIQERASKSRVNHDLVPKSLDEFVELTCTGQDFTSEMFRFKKNLAHYRAAFPNAEILEIPFMELTGTSQFDTVVDILRFIGLAEDAVEFLSLPLENRNEKKRRGKVTLVETVPAVFRPILRHKVSGPMVHSLANSWPLKHVRSRVAKQEEIPGLTPAQSLAIRNAFTALDGE